MTRGLAFLESFAVKIRGTQMHVPSSMQVEFFLPETLRDLKLQSVHVGDVIQFFRTAENKRSFVESSTSLSTAILQPHFLLQRLSLVLNIVSDELVSILVNSLPNLIHLDLEDRPSMEPIYPHDLTNYGLQTLGSCKRLTALSIVRSRHHHPASFKMINDMGMFLLSEGCQDLESVTLSGFSAVTDAGYSSFLRSCQGLKKFEIRHASLLSDLTFHDMSADCLVELRIVSCSFITSEAISQLNSSTVLEVLDTSGCRSIADTCLSYISGLRTLTNLNLSGAADVSDKGLATLSDADCPITRLSLRGCKRVSDRGIANLFVDGARICKTLTSLDLGHMPGITDRSFTTIASFSESLNELCIRYCFFVTDASLEILAAMRRFHGGSRSLQKLDLFNCTRLSTKFLVLLQKHTLRGLNWVGAGRTHLESRRDDFTEIFSQKPWLTVCFDGCEMGCHDGWQFHKRKSNYNVIS
ncbi:hypothetical protein Leryth_016125 [Lithospermum erythrorhizon]|nr:hypothetical protein Leryth_016125 [Lithospermum erythrorhizon]